MLVIVTVFGASNFKYSISHFGIESSRRKAGKPIPNDDSLTGP